ncbi:B155 [miniopterid betaherpesvirus 1]|uniref:B155 n=1 Tax=miniopterid betaherpesvirus 1 TaxID=3070189 RepID=I3VQF7_9BETA|nr:B155 [miniopterid betaherpesvirus 1]AFK84001.1 B155 [miniopterid betaherpesvirus 1]
METGNPFKQADPSEWEDRGTGGESGQGKTNERDRPDKNKDGSQQPALNRGQSGGGRAGRRGRRQGSLNQPPPYQGPRTRQMSGSTRRRLGPARCRTVRDPMALALTAEATLNPHPDACPPTVPARPVSLDYNSFIMVAEGFKWMYAATSSAKRLRREIAAYRYSRLEIGAPSGWALLILPPDEIPGLRDLRLHNILPCPEPWLVTVGVLMRGECYSLANARMSPLVFMLGRAFRCFVVDLEERRVHIAARDFEDFCHHGFVTVPCMYRVPLYPLQSIDPEDVSMALDGADMAGELGQITLRNVVRRFDGRDLTLRTPVRDHCVLRICRSWEAVGKMWPASLMPNGGRIEAVHRCITATLCCRWWMLGVAGKYRKRSADGQTFCAVQVLLFDALGRIYSYRVCDGRVCGLAPSVSDLMRTGLLRSITGTRWCGEDPDQGYISLEEDLDADYWYRARPAATQLAYPSSAMGFDVEEQFLLITRPGRFFSTAYCERGADGKRILGSRSVSEALATDDIFWQCTNEEYSVRHRWDTHRGPRETEDEGFAYCVWEAADLSSRGLPSPGDEDPSVLLSEMKMAHRIRVRRGRSGRRPKSCKPTHIVCPSMMPIQYGDSDEDVREPTKSDEDSLPNLDRLNISA